MTEGFETEGVGSEGFASLVGGGKFRRAHNGRA